VPSYYETFARAAAEICEAPMAGLWIDRGSERKLEACAGLEGSEEFLSVVAARSRMDRTTDQLETTDLEKSGIAFCAAAGLSDAAGMSVGTILVFDRRPRSLSKRQRVALTALAFWVGTLIETRDDAARGPFFRSGRLDRALELVADPIAILRLREPGRLPTFAHVNGAFTTLFGYKLADVAGKTASVLSGPETGDPGVAATGTFTYYTATRERRIVRVRDRELDARHRIASFRDLTQEHAATAALADAHVRLQSLIAANTEAVFTFDLCGSCIDANPAAEALFGLTREEMLGSGLRARTGAAFPSGEAFPQVLLDGAAIAFEADFHGRTGRRVKVECDAIPMVVRGVTEGAYMLARDVTERRRLAEVAERQAERARALSQIATTAEGTDVEQIDAVLKLALATLGMHDAYVAAIRGPKLVMTNVVGARALAVDEELDVSKTQIPRMVAQGDVIFIEDVASLNAATSNVPAKGAWRGYVCAPLRLSGTIRGAIGFLSHDVRSYDEADLEFVRLVSALISAAIERREKRARLDELAYVDSLTELPNRAFFKRALAREIEAKRGPFAIHYIDLDAFKALNDRVGHSVGDLALREIAARLRSLCGPMDIAARLGGDEFVVLQRAPASREDAEMLAGRLLDALAQPYRHAGLELDVGGSIGIAFFPADGEDADAVMRQADAALYRAKGAGKLRFAVASDEA
jgi:diguanylate cyclase (GGDEF)-like protein/PAS domain S-box-containing protein